MDRRRPPLHPRPRRQGASPQIVIPPDGGPAFAEDVRPAGDVPSRHVVLGTLALAAGTGLVLMTFADRMGGLPFDMPRSWYAGRPIWYLMIVVCYVGGWALLRGREMSADSLADFPGRRFERVVLYTRQGCHLCDEAKAVLQRYASVLPSVEEVDIDGDPRLVEQYGTCVPVVEIDGQVRFRGRVNEVLLRRLIENAGVANLQPDRAADGSPRRQPWKSSH
jgi:glutaredoxin